MPGSTKGSVGEFAYKEQGGQLEKREPPPHLTPFKPGASCKSGPAATFNKCAAAGLQSDLPACRIAGSALHCKLPLRP
jgi:hypothetical protein